MDRHVVAAGVLDAPQVQDLGAGGRHLEHLLGGDPVELAGGRHDPRVGGEDAVDVAVDLADVGTERGGQRDRRGVGAPRPSVVTSLVSWETPWKPATIAIAPPRGAFSIRPGVMSMILALPCAPSR